MLVGRLTLQFHSLANRKSRIITCVVVAFYPVNPLNILLHFYAIGVWIRSENRWGSFCPVFYKSQCFQASAAFITEAEILMKPARIRRYLISSIFASPHPGWSSSSWRKDPFRPKKRDILYHRADFFTIATLLPFLFARRGYIFSSSYWLLHKFVLL